MSKFDAFPITPPGSNLQEFSSKLWSTPGIKMAANPLTNYHAVLEKSWWNQGEDLYPPVQWLWAQVEARLAALQPGQKFFIVMGETYATTSHYMLQAGLLTQLVRYRDAAPDDPARKIIHVQKFPYNKLANLARKTRLRLR